MKKNTAKKMKLDKFEQEIEDSIHEAKPVSNSRIIAATKLISELKSERVNARFAARDIALLKERADREGMPYQTLMGSVLHKFVTGKLVDVDDVPKIAKLLKK